MKRDSIDFGTTKISVLFTKLFVPTLLSFIALSCVNVADGIFVGQGVGSDALAAVNIVAPLFMIASGIGLMFGAGGSIVAAIQLAKNNEKAARINTTQAFLTITILMTIVSCVVMIFQSETAILLGNTEVLHEYVYDYMRYIVPSLPFIGILCVGTFILRLDGSPTFAMLCEVIASVVNIILDYIFVFPLQMGISGAALATAISQVLGAFMVAAYMLCFSKTLRLYWLKWSVTSLRLTMRNIGYMAKAGSSSLIGEFAISCVILVGNWCFYPILGEDGIAAYGVVCYCFPIIFMIGNSVAQASQPILSYNVGQNNEQRIQSIFQLDVKFSVVAGLLLSAVCILCGDVIVSVFLDEQTHAFELACDGFSLFSIGYFFITMNLVLIGYFQSLEKIRKANVYMLLRGFFFVVPIFVILPKLLGAKGLWLSIPFAEILTTVVICLDFLKNRKK